MSQDIREAIVARRRERIRAEGHEFGRPVPGARQFPVVSFAKSPLLICEIKRKSPSRGTISALGSPIEQAGHYYKAGVRSVSILTEEDYFGGSLQDLMDTKARFPDLALLRKDFLVDEEDINVAWRAGADAVLLIAAMLDAELFAKMYRRALDLGLEVLVELHDPSDADKVRAIRPALVGVNCRDLITFAIDPMVPLAMRRFIDWPCTLVWESGVWGGSDVRFARSAGYDGVLVGESVMRESGLVPELVSSLREEPPRAVPFWHDVAGRLAERGFIWNRVSSPKLRTPLVKICGICSREDADLAARFGADLVGFVFAPSPRRSSLQVLKDCASVGVPKVIVITDELPDDAKQAISLGLVDAVQISGSFTAIDELNGLAHFRVVHPATVADVPIEGPKPRVLLDAYVKGMAGGTGARIDTEILAEAAKRAPLWLAGGLSAQNIREVVTSYQPELVDLSSSLESSPGKKDPAKIEAFMKEVRHAGVQ